MSQSTIASRPGVPEFAASPDRRCVGIPVAMFFPEPDEDTSMLRKLCLGCPVRVACREYAIEHYEHGWWGATDDRDRTLIRNRRAREAGLPGKANSGGVAKARRIDAQALAAEGFSRDVIAERLHITRRHVDRLLTSGNGVNADQLHERRVAAARLHAKGLGPSQIGRALGISRKAAASAIKAVESGLVAA